MFHSNSGGHDKVWRFTLATKKWWPKTTVPTSCLCCSGEHVSRPRPFSFPNCCCLQVYSWSVVALMCVGHRWRFEQKASRRCRDLRAESSQLLWAMMTLWDLHSRTQSLHFFIFPSIKLYLCQKLCRRDWGYLSLYPLVHSSSTARSQLVHSSSTSCPHLVHISSIAHPQLVPQNQTFFKT